MAAPKLLAAALAVALLGGAARAAPLELRVAWVTVPSSLAPILGARPELAPHLGKSYVVTPIHFTGSSTMTTALASGDLDIAELSYSSFAYAIQNAHMDDLRIIADEIQDGTGDYYSTAYMVLKDGPVHAIEDLKGKVVGTNVIGAGTDIGLRTMLRRHGLEDKRDYTVIETSYANMKPLLFDHKADLVTAIAYYEDAELKAGARPLFHLRDIMGTTQILALAARAGFIAQHRDALVDYLADVQRALHWYLDPANHAAAVAIVAAFAKQPAERFEPWLLTTGDQYHDPDGRPDLAAMQRNIDLQRDAGFLTAAIDVRKFADLSLVEEAAQRLKAAH